MDGRGEGETCKRHYQRPHCVRLGERVVVVVVVEVQGTSRRLNLDVVTRDDILYGREIGRECRMGEEDYLLYRLSF